MSPAWSFQCLRIHQCNLIPQEPGAADGEELDLLEGGGLGPPCVASFGSP